MDASSAQCQSSTTQTIGRRRLSEATRTPAPVQSLSSARCLAALQVDDGRPWRWTTGADSTAGVDPARDPAPERWQSPWSARRHSDSPSRRCSPLRIVSMNGRYGVAEPAALTPTLQHVHLAAVEAVTKLECQSRLSNTWVACQRYQLPVSATAFSRHRCNVASSVGDRRSASAHDASPLRNAFASEFP